MSEVENISNNKMHSTRNPLTSCEPENVMEVPIDSDLAIIEPVVETVEIDSDDTDYSADEENTDTVDIKFVDSYDCNSVVIKEETDRNSNAEPSLPAVTYNNSKYYKKQKTSENVTNNHVPGSLHRSPHQNSKNSTAAAQSSKRRRSSDGSSVPFNIKPDPDIKVERELDVTTEEGDPRWPSTDVAAEGGSDLKERLLTKYTSVRDWVYTRLGNDLVTGARRARPYDVQFRIMTYNLLSRHRLHKHRQSFKNKQEDHLSWPHRLEAVTREVTFVKPDILCVQELDFNEDNTIDADINELMKGLGYICYAVKRRDPKMDGCGIFFRESVFTCEEAVPVNLWTDSQDNVEALKGNTNVGIILRLKTVPKQLRLVVGTVHFKYGKDKELTRLAQSALFIAELRKICKETFPCIFAGDFNLEPYTDVHRLIVKGTLKYQGLQHSTGKYPDCIFPAEFGLADNLMLRPERNFKHGSGKFSHDFGFRSVYQYREERSLYLGYAPPESEVTAYQGKWVNVDHMFYSTAPCKWDSYNSIDGRYEKDLKLLAKWSLPSASQIKKLGGLPSLICPSDHLPLAAEFVLPSSS
eukprot:TRINITY_DN20407_c0_g2_i4.p1 TRINITY_DN20407_c0_g2~~TRINITY_DN20407_c0_g2_i4.p1  ORF type:complete len:581 (+),score=97.10 TRINITY_DN20407_c0_g2_i4:139-1881(+)